MTLIKIPATPADVAKLADKREHLHREHLDLIHEAGRESQFHKRQALGEKVRKTGESLDAADAEYRTRREASGLEGWERLRARPDYQALVTAACVSWAERLEALAALHVAHRLAGSNGIDVPLRRRLLPLLVVNELREFEAFCKAQECDLEALPPACRAIVEGGLL